MPLPSRKLPSMNHSQRSFPIRLSPSSYASQRRRGEQPLQIPQSLKTFSSLLTAKNKQTAAAAEDHGFKSSASEEDDDLQGWGDDKKKNSDDPSSSLIGGDEDQNKTGGDGPSLPENPVSSIGSNPLVIKSIAKLMELQEEEDIQRYICRANPSHRKPRHGHPNSDCCFANWNNNRNSCQRGKSHPPRIKGGCGPFLSCMVKHGKSNDFEELPEFYVDQNLMKNGFDYPPAWLQGPPQNNRVQQNRTSTEKVRKCRGCPTTSIFLSEPDLWLADYKYQVTYGKIPTADKKRLKERMEQWIPSDDYKERQAWLRQRMAALTKSQKYTLRQHPSGLPDKDIYRRPFNENGPMYGPSAIAALSGYSSPRPILDAHKNKAAPVPLPKCPQSTLIDYNYGTLLASNQDIYYTGDDVPWPSDNLRYYDDDTDPRVTELLAQAPFLMPSASRKVEPSPPNATTQKPLPIQPSPSKISQIGGPSSSGNQSSRQTKAPGPGNQPIPVNTIVTPPVVDYVVGSGSDRAPVRHETLTTKQTPISTPRVGPATAAKVVNDGMKSKSIVTASSSSFKLANKTVPTPTPRVTMSKIVLGESRGSKIEKPVPKFIPNKKSEPQKIANKVPEPVPSSSIKMMPPTTPKPLHVKNRISKTKTKRRFKQNISTVTLGVPKSKDSKVCFDDDK